MMRIMDYTSAQILGDSAGNVLDVNLIPFNNPGTTTDESFE